MNDNQCHCSSLLFIFDTTVSTPYPTFVPTHFTETQDNDEWMQATSSRGEPRMRCKHATRTTMTWYDDNLTARCNDNAGQWGNNTWWQQRDQDTGLREPWHVTTRRRWWHTLTRWCQHSTTTDKDPAPSTATKAWHHKVTTTHKSVYPSTSPFPLSTFSLTFPLVPFNTPFPSTSPFPPTSPFPLNLL